MKTAKDLKPSEVEVLAESEMLALKGGANIAQLTDDTPIQPVKKDSSCTLVIDPTVCTVKTYCGTNCNENNCKINSCSNAL